MNKTEPSDLSVLIRGHLKTASHLADVLGCSTPTASRKLADTDTLTVRELLLLAKEIKIEKIREAIR